MAATRLIAMHMNKGKSLSKCLKERTDYEINPDKTEGGKYVSSYACDPKTVVEEFVLSKREYEQKTGKQPNSVLSMERYFPKRKQPMLSTRK